MDTNHFYEKFKIDELKIFETNYWVWSLRPQQVTLGAGILSLKRECSAFSQLKSEEYKDLENVIKINENTLKSLFNYDIMNYLMLMMIDKQVHFHIIPRYENKFEYFNVTWEDLSWPRPPSLDAEPLEIDTLKMIASHIKNNLIYNFT